MSSITQTLRRLSLAVVCVGLLLPPVGFPEEVPQNPVAKVLSPADGARVPRDDDPPCPDGHRHCIYVEGQVPTDLWPFLAVAPLNASPKIWVQPAIQGRKSNGGFTGMVYLGTERLGAGEKYNIFVFACQDKQKFQEGQVLVSLPDDCLVSAPTTVLRTK